MKIINSIVFYLIATMLWGSVTTGGLSKDAKNTILYVKSGAGGDCASWTTACDLQIALSSAESGDQLWIAAGTYIPTDSEDPNATFQLPNGVALYGGFPGNGGDWQLRDWEANLTILSGDYGSGKSYHVVSSDAVDNTTILNGFIISDGSATYYFEDEYGGGMFNANSSLTLSNIIFSNNRANYGGGMYNVSSSPILTNVTFSDNTAALSGGGIYNKDSNPLLTDVIFNTNMATNEGGAVSNTNSNPTITRAVFSNNSAGRGGAMYSNQGSLSLADVTFAGNTGFGGGGMYNYEITATLENVTFTGNTTGQAGADGGGMYTDESTVSLSHVLFSGNSAAVGGGGMSNEDSNITLTNVEFSGNSAEIGGGMYNYEGTAMLTNVTFSNNSAVEDGGGMLNYSYYSHTGGILLNNVTFSGNSAGDEGGGMNNDSRNSSLSNVTFYGNSAPYGGGLYVYYGASTLTNAILWENTDDQIYIGSSASAAITYSIFQGGYTGTGNINENPRLTDLSDNGGFSKTHAILAGSPAIDAGSPDLCSSTDQRGYPRPYDGDGDGNPVCDMGAFEVQPYSLSINTTGNGQVNVSPEKSAYDFGDIVLLTAIADSYWIFTEWSGDALSTENPLTITIHGNTVITAIFNEDLFKVYLPLNLK